MAGGKVCSNLNLFITGTDTGVGKTYVACLILRALAAQGRTVAAFKPICCGDRDDAEQLLLASGREDLSLDEVNPVWLKSPVAPLAAGRIENQAIDLHDLARAGRELAANCDCLVVEGAGGWEVPVTGSKTVADFAEMLGFPALVVVNNQLGALNHTILTVSRIRTRDLPLAGLILNQVSDSRDLASISNRPILEEFLDAPVLAEILYGEDQFDPRVLNLSPTQPS